MIRKSFSLIIALMLPFINTVDACSMFKVTKNGKTIVGDNEDQWKDISYISFEKATKGRYGVVYFSTYPNSFQEGGMNEYGLTFGGLSIPYRTLKQQRNKKDGIVFRDLKKVLYVCKNTDEVFALLNKYDMSWLNGGMLFFTDRNGKYLVVEADTIIAGNDTEYVLSNFSRSQTKNLDSVKLKRYQNGRILLAKGSEASINFCKQMMDTMHICRSKVGDGTFYTVIYDLTGGIINLYFYHDFNHSITFDLKKELGKGNHRINIPSLFPENKEYKRFQNYLTPQNYRLISSFFGFCFLLFLFSAIFFIISFAKSVSRYRSVKIALAVIYLLVIIYLKILKDNQAIFYFPAPYNDTEFWIVNIASYMPFVLLLFIIPLIVLNVKLLIEKQWSKQARWLLIFDNVACLVLIGLFAYWKLYDIF